MLRHVLVLAFALGSAAPASLAADDGSYAQVVSALGLFFDGRNGRDPDRAVLVENACAFDLYLYVVDPRGGRNWSAPPTLVKRGLGAGPYCGEGTLTAGPNGALDLTIVNDWRPPRASETLTIRYQGGDFVVSAYRSWTSRFSGPDADAKRDFDLRHRFSGQKGGPRRQARKAQPAGAEARRLGWRRGRDLRAVTGCGVAGERSDFARRAGTPPSDPPGRRPAADADVPAQSPRPGRGPALRRR